MDIQVRQGDTLWLYSQIFKIPFDLILDSNRNIDQNNLRIGQTIKIPGYRQQTYTVKLGDSLFQIARQKGLSLEAMLLVNQAIDPIYLQVGQQINIPFRVTSPIVKGQKAYDYAALQQDLAQIVDLYPFVVRRQIGNSVMGKNLDEIQIGRGNKRIHLNASFHANEWITTPILMQTLNTYLLALTNNTTIRGRNILPFYNQVFFSLVPMVNPDGVDLVINGPPNAEPFRSNVLAINGGRTDFSGWKANIRGVDLNNQFPALWEREAAVSIKEPAPRDFPGYQPLSEPETIALAELTRNGNFDRVLAYHTQGKVIYWGFEGMEVPYSETLVNEFARVSGYQPIRYVEGSAGYKDWFIYEFRKPGFTVELGKGINPLPLSDFQEIYEENLGIFLTNLYM